MTIHLIRHGKTEANEKHLYCGSTDLPLSPEGRAELAGRHIHIPSDVRFISSGMLRTNETLELLFTPITYDILTAFREMDFGAFEMHSYDELRDDPDYQAWLTGDNDANPTPGGESGNEMTARVMAAFNAVSQNRRNSAIVTHGGVIAAIMASLFPDEGKNRYEWQPRPGYGYKLDYTDGQWTYKTV